jgi:hypothetical protein
MVTGGVGAGDRLTMWWTFDASTSEGIALIWSSTSER